MPFASWWDRYDQGVWHAQCVGHIAATYELHGKGEVKGAVFDGAISGRRGPELERGKRSDD